jgi:RNA polymerase sigma-70 factor (ECF subfamily)
MDQKQAKEYFLEMHTLYADAIFRFCVMKVSNREIAQDLTQEAFMRLWQTFRDGKHVENVRALLYTMTRNLITDWYRRKKSVSLDVLTEDGVEFAGDDHHDTLQSSEVREAIGWIHTLDARDQEVLLLRFVEGLQPREIAHALGEPVGRISVRINRATEKLRERIHHYE